jgi:hypothetical protein
MRKFDNNVNYYHGNQTAELSSTNVNIVLKESENALNQVKTLLK